MTDTTNTSANTAQKENSKVIPLLGQIDMRDYFAAHASEQDIADFLPQTMGEAQELRKQDGITRTRQWARYMHADAMLEARKS